jgi:hypothetical protein
MKRVLLSMFALTMFAGMVVTPAQAQHHRHCWYSHHHKHCSYR